MLRITKNEGNLVEVIAEGTLNAKDYERVIPQLEKATKKGDLRMLVSLRDFTGMTPKAVVDDLKFDVKHHDDFKKIAIVGEGKLEEWATKLSKPLFSAEMKYFEDESRARAWVQA